MHSDPLPPSKMDSFRQMKPIFSYDDGVPICFFIDKQDPSIITLIEVCSPLAVAHVRPLTTPQQENGGEIGHMAKAQFRISRDPSAMAVSGLPTIHPGWVTCSVERGAFEPMYLFEQLEHSQHNYLSRLPADQRDIAELLKARMYSPIDQETCEILHRTVCWKYISFLYVDHLF